MTYDYLNKKVELRELSWQPDVNRDVFVDGVQDALLYIRFRDTVNSSPPPNNIITNTRVGGSFHLSENDILTWNSTGGTRSLIYSDATKLRVGLDVNDTSNNSSLPNSYDPLNRSLYVSFSPPEDVTDSSYAYIPIHGLWNGNNHGSQQGGTFMILSFPEFYSEQTKLDCANDPSLNQYSIITNTKFNSNGVTSIIGTNVSSVYSYLYFYHGPQTTFSNSSKKEGISIYRDIPIFTIDDANAAIDDAALDISAAETDYTNALSAAAAAAADGRGAEYEILLAYAAVLKEISHNNKVTLIATNQQLNVVNRDSELKDANEAVELKETNINYERVRFNPNLDVFIAQGKRASLLRNQINVAKLYEEFILLSLLVDVKSSETELIKRKIDYNHTVNYYGNIYFGGENQSSYDLSTNAYPNAVKAETDAVSDSVNAKKNYIKTFKEFVQETQEEGDIFISTESPLTRTDNNQIVKRDQIKINASRLTQGTESNADDDTGIVLDDCPQSFALDNIRYLKTRETGDEVVIPNTIGRTRSQMTSFDDTFYNEYKMRRKAEVLSYLNSSNENQKTRYASLSRLRNGINNSKLQFLRDGKKCETPQVKTIRKKATRSGIRGDRTLLFLDRNVKYIDKL